MKKQWLIRISPIVFVLWCVTTSFAERTVFDGSAIEPIYQETGSYRDSLRRERRERFNRKTTASYRHALGFAVGDGYYGPTYKLKLPRGFSAQLTLMGWKYSRSNAVDTTIPPEEVRYHRADNPDLTFNANTRLMSALLLEKSLHRMRYGELCAFGNIGGYYNRQHSEGYWVQRERDTTSTDSYDYIYNYEYTTAKSKETSLYINTGVGASVFFRKMVFEAKGNMGVSWRLDNNDFYIGFGLRLAALFRFGKIDDKKDNL